MKRLLAMAIGLALCSTAAVADPHTIAFSLKTVTNDDFQKAIATSIQQAVEKSGNKFLLVTAGDETGNQEPAVRFVHAEDAAVGANHPAVADQLVHHAPRRVRGDRQPDAGALTCPADDRRRDADQLAVAV